MKNILFYTGLTLCTLGIVGSILFDVWQILAFFNSVGIVIVFLTMKTEENK